MSRSETLEIRHSKLNMASYGFGKFLNEFIDMAFATFGFFYYEYEIGLDIWLVGLGYIIFAIYNAINDPLVGYTTNRPFKFTKKWGRRFPWILFGGLFWILSYYLIFSPPAVSTETISGSLIIFAWLIFATCLFDTFASIFFVNFASLFPDKFRSIEERRNATGIATFIGIFGVALGAIIPPLLIKFENLHSYIIQAGAMILIGIVVLALSIPGCREDQILIDRYLITYEDKAKRESFFGTLKVAMKQKAFVVFIITYTLYRGLVILIQASIPYLVRFVLRKEPEVVASLSVGFLIGALISIPFWIFLAKKTNNNRKVMIIAGFAITIFTIPLIFITDVNMLIIAMILWGFCLGGFWVMLAPVLADVIDESVVKTGKREEGIYNGFQQFFGRFGIMLQAIIFVLVHVFTGFDKHASNQSDLAVWGIQIHFALIPMILILLATIIFWKWYDLTPDKVKINQEKVKEMGL